MLSYFFENYFITQTKDFLNSNPESIDLTKYILYKTPEILIKTKSIKEISINDNYPIDDIITGNNNIKFIIIHTKNKNLFNKEIVNHPIAKFQNIYSLNHIDIDNMCNYIYDNNFLMKYLETEIPNGIVNINILQDYKFRMNGKSFPINYPTSVKKIRINIVYVKESIKYCMDMCENLPLSLEMLIITYCDYYRVNYYIEKIDFESEIKQNIKIPFGCKIIIEKIIY